jgi:hypothetical protein
MSYAIVTWCSTAPPANRFCAAPAILPAGEVMSLIGWYVAAIPRSFSADHPVVEIRVGLDEGQPGHQRLGHVERVRDGVARLD